LDSDHGRRRTALIETQMRMRAAVSQAARNVLVICYVLSRSPRKAGASPGASAGAPSRLRLISACLSHLSRLSPLPCASPRWAWFVLSAYEAILFLAFPVSRAVRQPLAHANQPFRRTALPGLIARHRGRHGAAKGAAISAGDLHQSGDTVHDLFSSSYWVKKCMKTNGLTWYKYVPRAFFPCDASKPL
jgi:hypothetical protein